MLDVKVLLKNNKKHYIFSLDDIVFWNYIIKYDKKFYKIKLGNIDNGFKYFFGCKEQILHQDEKDALFKKFFNLVTSVAQKFTSESAVDVPTTTSTAPKKSVPKDRSAKIRKWKLCNIPYVSLHYTPNRSKNYITFRIRFAVGRSKAHPKMVRKDYPFTKEGLINACVASYDYSVQHNLPIRFDVSREEILKGDISNDLDFLELATQVANQYNTKYNENYAINLQFSKFSKKELN
jgi:hypothetical protein